MHGRTFCNALSMFALGTPSARAFMTTLKSATFFSGSAGLHLGILRRLCFVHVLKALRRGLFSYTQQLPPLSSVFPSDSRHSSYMTFKLIF
jgi:hypothetical protein